MNKHQEIYDYFWKFYEETPIEGSMLFRHYLDELYELIKEHKKLKDKETPKKPIHHLIDFYRCVNCNNIFQNHHYEEYCPNCGQKLDWSDE